MEQFFDCAVNAIRKEEDELNDLFNNNTALYPTHHQGVCNLYETTFAYIIYKELLRCKYPLTVYWECQYPGNRLEHSDLALLNGNKVDSLIELKIWTRNDDRNIKPDIKKLENEKVCKKYMLIFGYGGDIEENDQYLRKENQFLILINKIQLSTKYFKSEKGIIENSNLNVFLYQI